MPAGTKIVIIDRDRSRSAVILMYAPANASGDDVPGGGLTETAVWRIGIDGAESASSVSVMGMPRACVTGRAVPMSRSGVLGENRIQPTMGRTAASRRVTAITIT
jgi:hypothetical protein